MKKFQLLLLTFVLVGCDSKPDGFSEYGFYMRDGSELTYLFNTKETDKVSLSDAATKTVEFKAGAELLVYMPGFNERKMLIYKAKPWSMYPRDIYFYVRQSDDKVQIMSEKVGTDLYRISGRNIPDSLFVGLSYMHGIDNVLFSGFTSKAYEDAVRESLMKRNNWGKAKTSFAKQVLEADFLESTKLEAKRVLSKDKEFKKNVAKREARDKERSKSYSPTKRKVDIPSEGKLKNIIVDYVGAVNRKQYSIAEEYVSGREASNLDRYKEKETVLHPKNYTHSNIQTQSATFFVKDGTPTKLKKDYFGWKISEY